MQCDYCDETFRLRESPARHMRAFYAIFMCPRCLCMLRPGNLQVGLLTVFTFSLLGALVAVFIDFNAPLLNFTVPVVLFFIAFSFWVASLFCKETVLLAVVEPEDIVELGLEHLVSPSSTIEDGS